MDSAANGVCRNPDGTFFVTDQEGHWNPQNRINHVVPGKGKFYGNMYSYGAPKDSSDSAMEQPLCWAHKRFDRSPAELLWVESPSWGELDGKLLHLSYGHGRVEVVPARFSTDNCRADGPSTHRRFPHRNHAWPFSSPEQTSLPVRDVSLGVLATSSRRVLSITGNR